DYKWYLRKRMGREADDGRNGGRGRYRGMEVGWQNSSPENGRIGLAATRRVQFSRTCAVALARARLLTRSTSAFLVTVYLTTVIPSDECIFLLINNNAAH